MEARLTECAVCHELFTIPKLLPCSHILCRGCLVTWLHSQPQAGCPLCRCTIVDPAMQGGQRVEEVVDGFPTDVAMAAMVEAETLLSKQHVCCVCANVAAVTLCLQCGDTFCQHCSNVHKKQSATKHHEVELLSSLTTEKLAAHHPATCPDHEDKVSELYCPSHDTSLCALCVTTTHRNCPDLVSLSSKTGELTAKLFQLDDKLDEAITRLDNLIHILDRHVQDMQTDSEAALMELRKVCDRLKAAIDARFVSVKTEVLDFVRGVTNKLTDFRKQVIQTCSKTVTQKKSTELYKKFTEHKQFKDMITMVLDRSKNIPQPGDLPDNLQLNHKLIISIDPQTVADIEMNLSRLGDRSFTPNNVNVKAGSVQKTAVGGLWRTAAAVIMPSKKAPGYAAGPSGAGAGRDSSSAGDDKQPLVAGVVPTSDRKEGIKAVPATKAAVPDNDLVGEQHQQGQMSRFDPMTTTLSKCVVIRTRSQEDPAVPGISCVVPSQSAEELYMTDYKNNSIKVCSQKSGHLLSTISLDVRPPGLTLVNDSLLAVTTAQSYILLIDITNRSRPRLLKKIVTSRSYCGITVDRSRNGPVLVVSSRDDDGGPASVDLITVTGTCIKTLVSSQNLPGLNSPWYLHTDTQRNVLYIADYGSDCVFCVQLSNGRLLSQLQHPKLSRPRQVCTDWAGNVYVASGGGGCLLVRSVWDEWRVLVTGKEHGEGDDDQPWGISITDNALVVSWGSLVVKRYDLMSS